MRKAGLLGEGQRLSRATHANVVQVHHLLASQTDDEVLLVMELCTGGSLQSPFNAGPMQLALLRRYATDVAIGLAALHARGMLHRDIKPANILIDCAGTAKLGDFGLVTDNLVHGYGSQAGYLDHVAPEILIGYPTSARTDVWAFGMTVYRLLHGAIWYGKSPPPHSRIPSGGFASSLDWLPHVPDAWRRFIRKSMHDDPLMRYQNAQELVDGLAQLPIDPPWACSVSHNAVTWNREHKDRRVIVEWTESNLGNHTWEAWSEPVVSGRRRTLAGSQGSVAEGVAEKGLKAFFTS